MEKISLVIPCYNEEQAFPFLIKELYKVINKLNMVDFEIIFVNNCSYDNTLNLMKDISNKDDRFKYISFSRNFGKDSSMFAGLQASTGDYVAILDADLQDPPELLFDMYEILKNEGYDSVEAVRANRTGDSFFRTLFANTFYKIMSKISMTKIENGARDFRLMTKQMKDSIISLEESERFTKGIFSWVGFKTKKIYFDYKYRVAGKSQLPMLAAFENALVGIVSFSTFPLLFVSILGMIIFFIAIIYTIFIIIDKLFISHVLPGYASLMCVMLFGFGINLLVLGIIGQYLAQTYLEVKHRPKYIIKETNINTL